MEIEINLKWLKLRTKTTRRQVVFVAMSLIALVQIVNMLTIKANHEVLRIVIDALLFLTGLIVGRKKG